MSKETRSEGARGRLERRALGAVAEHDEPRVATRLRRRRLLAAAIMVALGGFLEAKHRVPESFPVQIVFGALTADIVMDLGREKPSDGTMRPFQNPLPRHSMGPLQQTVSEHAPPTGSTVASVESAPAGPCSDSDRAHAEFRARREFGSLDGLRALSILGVIWHHASQPPFGWAFLGRGAEGVSFFFVISGFLITSLLLRERERLGSVSLTKFYARRTLRIFPLYFGVLAAFCLLGLYRGVDSDFGSRFFPHLPLYLTYTSNWSPARSAPFGYSWSLACEEQFYLLWPPVLVLLGMRKASGALVLLLAANRAAHFGLLDPILPQTSFLSQLLRTLQPAIVLGVLLAIVLHSKRGYSILAPILRGRAACLAAFAVVIGMLSLRLDLHSSLSLDAAMALAVGTCVVPAHNALTPFLSLGAIRRIGIVSYGMYMFHEPLRTVIRHFADLTPVMLFVALALLTWGAAELSYRTFEKPFRRLKARFERHRPLSGSVERLEARAPVRTAPTDGAWISSEGAAPAPPR